MPNFVLNRQFWYFGPNLPKKDMFDPKNKKWTSLYLHWSRYQISSLIGNFNSLGQVSQNGFFFWFKTRNEHHYQIWHIRISVPNFISSKQFWFFFWANLSEKNIYFQSKCPSPWNLSIISLGTQISSEIDNFVFLAQINPKRVLSV